MAMERQGQNALYLQRSRCASDLVHCQRPCRVLTQPINDHNLVLQVPAAMQKDLLFKSYPEKSFHNAMVLANHELHESPVDDMQSGTTAVNILVRGTGLYVANVGDSRAVLAERQGSKNVAINLTVDQTAFRYGHIVVVTSASALNT